MATSGSVDFTVTGSEIVEAALRVLGVHTRGETLSYEDLADGLQALNMLVKSWMGPTSPYMPGFKAWQRKVYNLTLTATASFTIKSGGSIDDADIPVQIISAVLRDSSGNDTPLDAMTRREYEAISDKSATGDPTKYLYEKALSQGNITFDYVPNDLTKTVRFIGLQPLEDMDAGTDSLDFPQEWFRVLKFALAKDLAPEYQVEFTQTMMDDYMEAKELAVSFDPQQQESGWYFQPGRD